MDNVNGSKPSAAPSILNRAWNAVSRAAFFFWKWSIPYRNRNLPQDEIYAKIWKTEVDETHILSVLQNVFPDITPNRLPVQEEQIRRLVRQCLPPISDIRDNTTEKETLQKRMLEQEPEEVWPHLPQEIRHILAAMNAKSMEAKLQLLSDEEYHPSQGLGAILRHSAAIRKTFRMWRLGFSAAVSRTERFGTSIFFIFLIFTAVYPNVAAGYLNERSYNQRSIGSRIMSLIQLFYLWTFPYHNMWLLFNWSLERLLGGLVGSTVYAMVAIFPKVRAANKEAWFRTMILVLTIAWQMGVQFSPAVRDYIVRLLTRYQMSRRRRSGRNGDGYWASVEKAVHHELISLQEYTEEQSTVGEPPQAWQDVPFKVRAERYIRFTSYFKVVRGADQLISLLKDDIEGVVNIYEDYLQSAKASSGEDVTEKASKSYAEPRGPKLMLVLFDIAVFAYVCYSFWSQPFTFNTVVAYSAVVVFKQTIVLCKRYQTVASASRLFTNMVAFNIWGIFLVSLPVTVDKHVLDNNGNWVALTLAMVIATNFLAEPIAPLFLAMTEKMVAGFSWVEQSLKR